MPSLPRNDGRRPGHGSQWEFGRFRRWPDAGPVFGILLVERTLHHQIMRFCRRRASPNHFSAAAPGVRPRAPSPPFPSPGSMLRSSKARSGMFVSPALARFQPGGRHRAPPTSPSNVKRGGRGRSSRTTSGETARAGFVYEVVQCSFHQPLRSCQFVSCFGPGTS